MIKLIMVESPRNGITPRNTFGVPLMHVTDYAPFYEISEHASEVADFLLGPFSAVSATNTKIEHLKIMELTVFAGKQCVGSNRTNQPAPFEPIWPVKLNVDVINISAGMVDNDFLRANERLDEMIERDNVVCVCAMPNKGQHFSPDGYAKYLFSLTKNSITVGSTRDTHHDWISDDNNMNRSADVLVNLQWSSHCAPVVSSLAAAIIGKFKDAGVDYKWHEIKDIVVRTTNNKELDFEEALRETDRVLNKPKEDPIMLKQLQEEINILKEENRLLNEIINRPDPVLYFENLVYANSTTQVRSCLYKEPKNTTLNFKYPRNGNWVRGGCVYDKKTKTFYVQ